MHTFQRVSITVLIPLLLAACDGGRPVAADGGHTIHTEAGTLPSCGDPEVMARFPTCLKAKDRQSCEAAGGTWTPIGLYPEPLCVCPTGQDGCPCTSLSQCLGSCRAEMVTMWECDMDEGTCAPVAPHVGCWCWFDDEGNVNGACAD